ncbi:MAG: tripartite tricarboxylate transporter substrate binding protein [Castellaniella sp.]
MTHSKIMKTRVRQILTGGALLATLAFSAGVHAWPDRPIKMIVPFPAGGINDVVGRLTASYLQEELGVSVVADNRTGAGGTIGTALAAESTPDGYTILLGASSTIATAPGLYRNLAYSPLKSFEAVGGIGATASVIVVASDSKWTAFGDLVQPDGQDTSEINYGSAGPGTSHHIKTETLKLRTGAKWTHVPYRGGAPAMTDLIGGQIDFLTEPLPTAVNYIQSGRVRPLAVTTAERSASLPDVQTLEELGIENFDASLWFGIFVPAGVDGEITDKLAQAMQRIFAREDVKKDFNERGLITFSGNREDFKAFVVSEIKVWGDAIQQAKIRIE